MNPLGVALSLVAMGVSGFLAVYVLAANPKASPHRAFFVLMMTFVWWDACEAVARALPSTAPASEVYPWVQGVWLGIATVPAALMQLALVYPEKRPWFRRGLLPLAYAPVVGWAILIFGTPYLIAGTANGLLGPDALVGDDYLALAAVYGAWFYVSVSLFVQEWWRVRGTNAARMQTVVVIGLLLGAFPAGATEIFWPLIGGTGTRLGLATLYTLMWSIFLGYAIVRYRYLTIEAVTEGLPPTSTRYPLARGFNYLVVEPGRAAGMSAFREIVTATPGLCVTALAPARVAERFGLERTPILWITRVTSEERTVRPQALDFELVHTVLKFLRENPGTAVLLDDLDYLASVNGFEAVARFVKRVANQASASGGTIIATAGHGTFTPAQLSVLTGTVDHVLELTDLTDRPLPSGRDNALLLIPPQDVGPLMPLVAAGRGLVVTTEHPSKARLRFREGFDILWVTEHPEPGTRCARPTALDTEAHREVIAYLTAHPGDPVILAGLDQLALFADFAALLAFVKDTVDAAALRKGRVLVTVSPSGLPPREVAMVARRLDVPAGPLLRSVPAGGLSTAAPGSRSPTRGPVS